jgi:hypothetical protein
MAVLLQHHPIFTLQLFDHPFDLIEPGDKPEYKSAIHVIT